MRWRGHRKTAAERRAPPAWEAQAVTKIDLSAVLPAPEFRDDPYPVYAALRQAKRVFLSTQFVDAYVLSRFVDCEAVLRGPCWSTATDFRHILDDDGSSVHPGEPVTSVDGSMALALS